MVEGSLLRGGVEYGGVRLDLANIKVVVEGSETSELK
jgi:hypothetical protein